MKVQKYQIMVADSLVHFTHTITEYYIPDLEIHINESGAYLSSPNRIDGAEGLTEFEVSIIAESYLRKIAIGLQCQADLFQCLEDN